MQRNYFIFFSLLICILLFVSNCEEPSGNNFSSKINKSDTILYLNHSDTASYVGIGTCKLCHQDIYNSFIKTGMGKSFDIASKQKSVADFKHSVIFDKSSDFYYKAFWRRDSLCFLEYRLQLKDTVFKRIETVNYIIGSGQHTNSHIQNVNGYLNQMPMTFYAQKKKWDLPPGFENGHNTRFTRKIGLECMTCHNAYPDFELGSENKYKSVPQGIDCERCHGPGSIHVAQRRDGSKIDTSKYVDYSIVNPAKLSVDLQFDICQRCHLQGNAVLKEGKSFFDFKPGMKLSDYITVFLPKYENADEEFIMASHADRLKQSACFIKSYEKIKNNKSLKPYKEALTCVTCHNPHISVRETNSEVFNDACKSCHNPIVKSQLTCSDKNVMAAVNAKKSHVPAGLLNCVSCHMPVSGSSDIPHVTVHDHYIRKPINKTEKDKIKKFIGLYAVNEKNTDAATKARAYINYYNKFEPLPGLLDSAKNYLKDNTKEELLKNIFALIELNFSKQNFNQIINYVTQAGEDYLYNTLITKKTYDNKQAWCAYHIAEAFSNSNNNSKAEKWFAKSVELAPYNLDFKNKLASSYINSGKIKEAEDLYLGIINQNPHYISAYTNLGFLKLSQNNVSEAEKYYNKALTLDSDYEPLLLNMAGLKAFKKEYKEAMVYLNKILNKNPNNLKARQALQQIKSIL